MARRSLLLHYLSSLAGTMTLTVGLAASVQAATPVKGTLIFPVFDDGRTINQIALPDATVTLVDGSGQTIDTAITNLDGSFSLSAPKPDRYTLCWQTVSDKGCGKAVSTSAGQPQNTVLITQTEKPYVYGTVLTGDRRPCWLFDSYFDIDVSTKVRGGGSSARANTRGEYVLFGVERRTFTVEARCENASVGGVADPTNASRRLDLNTGNRAPRLTGTSMFRQGLNISRALPAETLEVETGARDPESNALDVKWFAAPDSGNMAGNNGLREKWTLSPDDGNQTGYVVASDGLGGYAIKRIQTESGKGDLVFSGRVLDETTGAPIAGAEVEVAGNIDRTNIAGWFRLTTPPQNDDRYVMNVRHRNYALVSRVYDRSQQSQTLEMQKAQVTAFSGRLGSNLVDGKSSGSCGGKSDFVNRIVRRVEPTLYQDDSVKTDENAGRQLELMDRLKLLLAEQANCNSAGASIAIPANGLVDVNGQRVVGRVRAAVTTLNPARRALPGDYQAITATGERGELLSFGAVDVSLTDASGRKLNLAPGQVAVVRIPVPVQQLNSAQPTIPMWSYDEKQGVWIEEGVAKLVTDASGTFYEGETKHFSTLNMDVSGTDVATATCARVEIDSAFNAWNNLVLRAYVSYNGNAVQVKETPVNSGSGNYHAIFRIPFGNAFPPNTLRLELRGTPGAASGGQTHVVFDSIVNTDARPQMTGTTLFPSFPYTDCGDPILISPADGIVPNYGAQDAAGRPAFLAGVRGDFNPPNAAAITQAYYAAIDPGNAKTTLGGWWNANGFDASGGGGTNTSYVNQAYLNHNDLGFGRDMHCLNTGANLACYVTNYGLPDQLPSNADDAAAKNPLSRGATVAMEYNAAANPASEAVQFYVFGGGVATSARIGFADLDGFGPKPVPQLCAVCHGGNAALSVANKVEFARFREFDLPSFRYTGGDSWDYGQPAGGAAPSLVEFDKFAKLNQMVRAAHPTTPIGSLISAWYPSGSADFPRPIKPTPPTGWNASVADQNAYHLVYGPSCRTCHIARDGGTQPPLAMPFPVFDSQLFFSFTESRVCGSGSPTARVMPNAVVTYRNFWKDTTRVAEFEATTGQAIGTCDD